MGDFPHEGGSTTRTNLFNESNYAICHVCFCYGHIASKCPNNVENIKIKDFKDKSNNVKNEFSNLIASSSKESPNFDSKNLEKEICVLKQKLEESENKLKNEIIDFDKCIYKMQKSLMTSDDTIEELESEIVTIKSERDNFSNDLACAQNKLSTSENCNLDLEKKVVTLNKEISSLKQKLDDSDNKSSREVVNTNNDKLNFSSFATTLNDCDIFTNNSVFDFRDDKIMFDFEGDAEIDYDEKFRELLNDYVLKRKENLNFCEKIVDLEKEVKFLKSCLGESEKKLEMQNFVFEEKLMNSQSKYLSSLKDLDLQRAEFLEKLKESQIKFLSCEKARKDLEMKISTLTSELENYKSISHKFTNGSQGLDKLLSIGKNAKDRSGLGFDKCGSSSSAPQTTFVKAATGFESSKPPHIAHVSKVDNFQKTSHRVVKEKEKVRESFVKKSPKKFIPICHHCGIVGHIRPKCFKLLNGTSSYKTNFEKLNFVVKKSPISKKNFNSKETFLSNSKFKTFDNKRNTSTYSSISHNKFVPTCHHCGCLGHIRPMCSKFLNDQSYVQLGASNRFHVSKENFVSKNSNFQKPSPNVFEKVKVKASSNRISHQRFVPKCHQYGEIGHIRPKCQKISKEKTSLEINSLKKFDEIANEISKLKNGMNRKPTFDLINSRNPGKMIWVKKESSKENLKDNAMHKVFDSSKIKILERPSVSSKLKFFLWNFLRF